MPCINQPEPQPEAAGGQQRRLFWRFYSCFSKFPVEVTSEGNKAKLLVSSRPICYHYYAPILGFGSRIHALD